MTSWKLQAQVGTTHFLPLGVQPLGCEEVQADQKPHGSRPRRIRDLPPWRGDLSLYYMERKNRPAETNRPTELEEITHCCPKQTNLRVACDTVLDQRSSYCAAQDSFGATHSCLGVLRRVAPLPASQAQAVQERKAGLRCRPTGTGPPPPPPAAPPNQHLHRGWGSGSR